MRRKLGHRLRRRHPKQMQECVKTHDPAPSSALAELCVHFPECCGCRLGYWPDMATASSFSALPGSGSLLHDGDDEGQEAGAGAGDIIVTPGEVITDATGFLRGHGSYLSRGTLVASVAGSVQRVNKLVSVQPVSSRCGGHVGLRCAALRTLFQHAHEPVLSCGRYSGHVGDVVVGRVVEVRGN